MVMRRSALLVAFVALGGCRGWTLPLPSSADTGVDDVRVSTDATGDAPDLGADMGLDAVFDVPADLFVPPDVTPDVPADNRTDVPVADVPVVDAPTDLDPPRPLAPMSTSTVSSQRPTLHWIVPA